MPAMVVKLLVVAAAFVGVVNGAQCGTNNVHDCGIAKDESTCTLSYTPPEQVGGAGKSCTWFAYEGKYSCVGGSACDIPTTPVPTPPPTPQPSVTTPAPLTTEPPTPTPEGDDATGMSKGIQTLLFFFSYIGAILTFWGGVKTYRYFFPPESKTQQALSLLRGGKK